MARIGGSAGPKIWNNSEQPQQQSGPVCQSPPDFIAAPGHGTDILIVAMLEVLRERSLQRGEEPELLVPAPKQKLVSSDELQIDKDGEAAWAPPGVQHAPSPDDSDSDDSLDMKSPHISDLEDEATG
jgi:hypothetical protein